MVNEIERPITFFEQIFLEEYPQDAEKGIITKKQIDKIVNDWGEPAPKTLISKHTRLSRGVFRFKAGFDIVEDKSLIVQPPEQSNKHVETDEELDLRIRQTYDNMDTLTNSVADGITKSMIVSGSAGIGKSFGIKKILDDHTSDYLFVKGYVRPTGIFKLLYENRYENQVLIFDDADSIFFDETGLNLLKGALELSKSRTISWLSEKTFSDTDGEEIPKTFDYHGTIIFLTNLNFNELIEKGNKISPHLEALRSRSIYFDMKIRSKREVLCRIKQVVAESGILSDIGLNRTVQEDLMQYLTDNMNRTIELSLRTVEKLSALYKASPTKWRNLADSVILK